jgi:hypothetical protein
VVDISRIIIIGVHGFIDIERVSCYGLEVDQFKVEINLSTIVIVARVVKDFITINLLDPLTLVPLVHSFPVLYKP